MESCTFHGVTDTDCATHRRQHPPSSLVWVMVAASLPSPSPIFVPLPTPRTQTDCPCDRNCGCVVCVGCHSVRAGGVCAEPAAVATRSNDRSATVGSIPILFPSFIVFQFSFLFFLALLFVCSFDQPSHPDSRLSVPRVVCVGRTQRTMCAKGVEQHVASDSRRPLRNWYNAAGRCPDGAARQDGDGGTPPNPTRFASIFVALCGQ